MKTTIYKSEERGTANFGWLKAKYVFSFANYYDPRKVHFGVLRVLNDDLIDPDNGFGTHPHDNMEIVSIPLAGQLAHKDSTGGQGVISKNEIQIMSAGTGVEHSEFNPSKDTVTNLLQIWLFPKKQNINPRYGQMKFDEADRRNKFQTVIDPVESESNLTLNQDAWFHLGSFDEAQEVNYQIRKPGNGLYAFIIKGKANVAGTSLSNRDSVGISEVDAVNLKIEAGSEVLLIDLPMELG